MGRAAGDVESRPAPAWLAALDPGLRDPSGAGVVGEMSEQLLCELCGQDKQHPDPASWRRCQCHFASRADADAWMEAFKRRRKKRWWQVWK